MAVFATRAAQPFADGVLAWPVAPAILRFTRAMSDLAIAEKNGYIVEGFAPTSKAAGQLREAGIDATTLQSLLARGENHRELNPETKHLYMLDESSLASTRQMRAFLDKLNPDDRVLVIGDTRQHQGVDAGRPFQQMQEAGMQTSQLDRIMREKDPELLKAVQHLANNETEKGIAMLAKQGRVSEITNGQERISAIAKDYAAQPENTIIVSPDNQSRQQINEVVHAELLQQGSLLQDWQKDFFLAYPDEDLAHRLKLRKSAEYQRGSLHPLAGLDPFRYDHRRISRSLRLRWKRTRRGGPSA